MKTEYLKLLAQQYADRVYPENDDMDAFERGREWAIIHDNARAMLEWLCETHCVVEKDKIGMLYGASHAMMNVEPENAEFYRGRASVLEELFGDVDFSKAEQ